MRNGVSFLDAIQHGKVLVALPPFDTLAPETRCVKVNMVRANGDASGHDRFSVVDAQGDSSIRRFDVIGVRTARTRKILAAGKPREVRE